MSEYDFLLKNMVYSYSSISSFEQCPYAFKLSYIKNVPRRNNAFAQFGNLMHDILEKYFSEELMIWDLVDYYKDNYSKKVKIVYPPNQYVDLSQSYYEFGVNFFDNFDFPLEDYDVFSIEKTIKFSLGEYKLSARPDLILTNKTDGGKILFDYKTEKLKTTKPQKAKQLEKIMRQMELYSYAIWAQDNIEVDEMKVWFVRDNVFQSKKVDPSEVALTTAWASETIEKIQDETIWQPTNTKENEFFCRYLCGVRGSCKYIDNPSP